MTLLVGYFILGPSDLYKLVKEIGKFIQSFRTLSSEASKSFESSMENQLELQELRKAQTELNNAFSFRRSINVDENAEAFSELPPMADNVASEATGGATAAAAAATATATGEKKKKKKRRRVKKKKQPIMEEGMDVPPYNGDIPDLDMSEEFKKEMREQLWSNPEERTTSTSTTTSSSSSFETEEEAAARIRNERMERLQNGQPSTPPDWYSASESDIANEVLTQQTNGESMMMSPTSTSPAETAAEQSRFASQLSGDWNQQILANEDQLSPLGKIMERLAILEEEKNAADARLEVEFKLRAENEEKFYREKRKVLEEASAEVAAATYNFDVEEKSKELTSSQIGNSSNTATTTISDSSNTTSTSVGSEKVEAENSTKA